MYSPQLCPNRGGGAREEKTDPFSSFSHHVPELVMNIRPDRLYVRTFSYNVNVRAVTRLATNVFCLVSEVVSFLTLEPTLETELSLLFV